MSIDGERLRGVIGKLKKRISPETPSPQIFNPFQKEITGSFKGIWENITWLNRRVIQGYFGIEASLDRSLTMESRSDWLIDQISQKRSDWHIKFSESIADNSTSRIKDSEIESLRDRWEKIEKGADEEEKWLIDALGLTAAYFEHYQQQKGVNNFALWDNQLLFTALLSLNKGHYSLGELATINRAIQLDTGEGKTFCSGLAACLRILQGKEVFIVEQNYISAVNHANSLAPFFADFLGVETGVVVDLISEKKIVRDVKLDQKGLISEKLLLGENLRKSFVYTNGKMHEQEGPEGRKRSWRKKIVYCDHNSIGTDMAIDRQLTTAENDMLIPDLAGKVGLVQEADNLVFDEAVNPFQIQTPVKGLAAWDNIAQLLFSPAETYLESKGIDISPADGKTLEPKTVRQKKNERVFAINFFYSLWANLYQIVNNTKVLKAMTDSHAIHIGTNQELSYDNSVLDLLKNNLAEPLSAHFNNDKTVVRQFLTNNEYLIDNALHVLLTGTLGKGFIPGQKPILMDQYGVPLDNRQKEIIYQVFLQLANIWEREGLTKKPYTADEIKNILNKTYRRIEVPLKIVNRILPSVLYRSFAELRMASGSLLPISQILNEIYDAETVAVSRHQKIEPVENKTSAFPTLCLDGGTAEVDFIEEQKLASKIFTLIQEVQSGNQAALIIMPDADSANKLNRALADFFEDENLMSADWESLVTIGEPEPIPDLNLSRKIELITGFEEYAKRGTLDKIISWISEGKIIITTQIAHRDIDPVLSPEVKQHGGLTTIVYNPPNERGLWQALQRSIRADIPGRRILLISEDSLKDIKYQYIVDPPYRSPLSTFAKILNYLNLEKQRKIDDFFQQASSGDHSAMEQLFCEYLNFFRRGESSRGNMIMFSLVKDFPLAGFRQRAMKYLQEDQANLWENYVNLITYAVNKNTYPRVKIKPGIINNFLNLPDQESRNKLLRDKGLYDNLDFLAMRSLVRKELLTSFWSDLLEAADFQYRAFYLNQLGSGRQLQSHKQFMGAWKDFLEKELLKKVNLEFYFRQKIDNLEI